MALLRHIALRTLDVPRMVDFYQGVFGFSVCHAPQGNQRSAMLSDGYFNLAILAFRPDTYLGIHHVGFWLRDQAEMEEVQERLRRHGASTDAERRPADSPIRTAEYRVHDPDGNGIDLALHWDLAGDAGRGSKIRHMALRSLDVPRLAAFYRDALGLTVLREPEGARPAARLTDGYVNLAILPFQVEMRVGIHHFGVVPEEIDHLEGLAERARRLGAVALPVARPQDDDAAAGRDAEVRLHDPDGNGVDLAHSWPTRGYTLRKPGLVRAQAGA